MGYKTDTTKQNTFHRRDLDDPHYRAIFQLNLDPSRPGVTRITLPEKSTWSATPHWHERYTECFQVIQGRVLLIVDEKMRHITPEDGPQRVPIFAVHDFFRADKYQPDEDKDSGDVITEEWTDPADGSKHVFFRNIFSTLQDADQYWGIWTNIQALTTASAYDNFIDIMPGRFSYMTTHILYTGIWAFAKLTGLSPWQKEYTPVELRAVAIGKESSKLK